MKLAYVTTYDSRQLSGSDEWSGTGYFIAQALENQSIDLNYLGPLKDSFWQKVSRKLKRHYYEFNQPKKYEKDPDPQTLKNYARQIEQKLICHQDEIIFSATINPISYLKRDRPIAFWADATFAGIAEFYPQYSNLHPEIVKQWHQMERLALENCQLAIYSSDWAAKSAVEFYQADPAKVKIVPFGANIDHEYSFSEIKNAIEAKPDDSCKLLFIGVDWHRKGGDTVYAIAKQLNQIGLRTELTVVGCQPLIDEPIPEFVKSLGFIKKSTPEGKERLRRLIQEAHFLILPSLADCTPMVFPEANSLGVPCISTKVGGIPTVIHDDENGKLFELNSNISEYCNYINFLFTDYSRYQQLAINSFSAYKARLNWQVAGQKVKTLLESIC